MQVAAPESAERAPARAAVSVIEGKVRGFLFERSSGAAARGTVAVLEAELDDGLWRPVAALAADRAGFVSFSLDPLRTEGRSHVRCLRVRAGGEAVEIPAYASLAAPAPAFVVSLDPGADAHAPAPELPAIQDPDDVDREISPGSFANVPMPVVGDDGCAQTIPGGLAAFDYGVYRVLRLARLDKAGADGDGKLLSSVAALMAARPDAGRVDVATELQRLATGPSRVQLGVVLRFVQRWQPIGQCLGDIVYSLPLAPGEARDLALIDWSRSDSVSRIDDIDSSEQLMHRQHRDRNIEEAVNAGLHEHQEGWSFMAGTAGAASASIPIETVKLSISGDHAIGVGIASTTGDRNLSGFSQQDLADTVTQATTVLRGLRSTVIVQADQNEANAVQTRTIANHNRCHSLTVQYYEVLRAHRVTTSLAGADLALLVPHALVAFDNPAALRWRAALERNLLDPGLAGCFDAVAHLERCTDTAYAKEPPDSPPPPPPPPPARTYAATSFTVRLDTGPRETWGSIWVKLVAADGVRKCILFKPNVEHYVLGEPREDERDRVLPKNSSYEQTVSANGGEVDGLGIDLRTVKAVEVEWVETNGQDGWAFSGISVTATADGKTVPLLVNGLKYFSSDPYIRSFEPKGHTHGKWTAPAKMDPAAAEPDPGPDPNPKPKTPAKPSGRNRAADKCCAAMLLGHLNDNAAYYSRVVWVGMDPTERRIRLVAALGAQLADAVDDQPLAVGGDQVAFQLNAVARDDPRLVELVGAPKPSVRYATLPARGVFAEAELGHCNACERRDVTRMTDWSPVRPPQIADVTPGPRGTTPKLEPTALPGPVVQVVQAPDAPDPVGLGAALALLGKPDIFRDMSGRAELEHLLSGLVSGAVSLTEAQILAGKVKEKQAQAAKSNGKGASGSPTRTPAAESDAGRQVDRLDTIDEARKSGLISDEDARGAALGVVGGESSPGAGAAPTTAWPRLDPAQVLPRIQQLAAHADKLSQGRVGLCTAAAFYHHIIQRNPVLFELFAKALYSDGRGFVGKLGIAPDADLRDADYGALAVKFPGMPPQADWMLMAALRDSENWLFDFEGAPDESVAMSTSAEEMSDWYEETGLYSGVAYSADRSAAKIKAIAKTATSHVALWIRPPLVGRPPAQSHMITVEGPIAIDEAADKVTFDYWEHGKPVATLKTTFTAMKANYLGSITATF